MRNPKTCPKCGSRNVYVTECRTYETYTKRRRECYDCGNRYTAYELVVRDFKRLRNLLKEFDKEGCCSDE